MNVAAHWTFSPNPPAKPARMTGRAMPNGWPPSRAGAAPPATRTPFDTIAVLPYCPYLAATGAFLVNHCSGFGPTSTPNHLLIVGVQSPTLRIHPPLHPVPIAVTVR